MLPKVHRDPPQNVDPIPLLTATRPPITPLGYPTAGTAYAFAAATVRAFIDTVDQLTVTQLLDRGRCAPRSAHAPGTFSVDLWVAMPIGLSFSRWSKKTRNDIDGLACVLERGKVSLRAG